MGEASELSGSRGIVKGGYLGDGPRGASEEIGRSQEKVTAKTPPVFDLVFRTVWAVTSSESERT